MKKTVVLFAFLIVENVNGQNYQITFSGTGESSFVNSVYVENLTSGTYNTLNGNDILQLSFVTDIFATDFKKNNSIRIYPNPTGYETNLDLNIILAGEAIISVYNIEGVLMATTKNYLELGYHKFKIKGLSQGLYFVSVSGNGLLYSGKIISTEKSECSITIEALTSSLQKPENSPEKNAKGSQTTYYMSYTAGDRLKFTGISGDYITVLTDVITEDKQITFNFISCKDGDNNSYPVVEIGTQVWMAQNLKTTKLNDNTVILNIIDNNIWKTLSTPSYCWYSNNETTYKPMYGALYNWYSVITGKICPQGWHVPSDSEWSQLTTNLGGESVAGGKLKETGTNHWQSPNVGATDETGYAALPNGIRDNLGSYTLVGQYASFWTSSALDANLSWYREIDYSHSTLYRSSLGDKRSGLSVRCLTSLIKSSPTVSTSAATKITSTSALVGGNVTSDGNAPVIERGVFWGTSSNPEISGSKLQIDNGTGTFSFNLTSLTCNSTYYFRAYAINISGISYGNVESFTAKLAIGEAYQGGIIAYLFQLSDPGYISGEVHGIIAAPSDLTRAEWGCFGTGISGADGIALGTGNQNTTEIVFGCSTAGIAAALCNDLILNSFNDWYLPSKDELNKLYLNKDAIKGFSSVYYVYWSSSEVGNGGAYFQYFTNGYQNITNKNQVASVRPVRQF